MLLAVPVMADETSSSNHVDSARHHKRQTIINYDVNRDDPLGLGVDMVVYEDENPDAKLEEVTIEARHDFENEETAVFGVIRWNVWKFFKK